MESNGQECWRCMENDGAAEYEDVEFYNVEQEFLREEGARELVAREGSGSWKCVKPAIKRWEIAWDNVNYSTRVVIQ